MRHIFVINPTAGKIDYSAVLRPRIEAAAAALGEAVEIFVTGGPQEAITFAKGTCEAAEGETLRFYACGGDGTLNEVVSGVHKCPTASVGVIPCGSGNDFVKSVDSSANFLDIKAQMRGEEKPIDLIQVNDRISVNVSNLGFDAKIADNMVRFKRWPLVSGPMAYNFAVAYVLVGKLGQKLTMEVDSETWTSEDYLLAAAANGRWYGGEFKAAPEALLDDGYFDLCAVKKISHRRIVSLIDLYRKGAHVHDEKLADVMVYRKCREMKVTAESPVPVSVDGEIFYNDTVHFKLLPKALRLIYPKMAR